MSLDSTLGRRPQAARAADPAPFGRRSLRLHASAQTSDQITLEAAVDAARTLLHSLCWWPDPDTENYILDTFAKLSDSAYRRWRLTDVADDAASRLICDLVGCPSLTSRALGARIEEAHRVRNALLIVQTADSLRAMPAGWPWRVVPAPARRGDRRRAATIDEIAVLRAMAEVYDLHEHLKPVAVYALLDSGLSMSEVTETRLADFDDLRRPTTVDAAGKRGWFGRRIALDPWQSRVLGSVISKMRREGAGEQTRLAYGGRTPRLPAAAASSCPVAERLIDFAQFDHKELLPSGVGLWRARHTLEACRDLHGAAALVGLAPLPILSGGYFGRLCERTGIRQEDAFDAVRSGPTRSMLMSGLPPAVLLATGRP